MKCLLRPFNPAIHAKSGTPLPDGERRSGWERWARFEALLEEALGAQGFEIDRQPEHPTEPDQDGEYALRVHAHRTRRDVPEGGLFTMQMHLPTLFTLDDCGWGADHSRVPRAEDFSDVDPTIASAFRRECAAQGLRSGGTKHTQPRGRLRARLRRALFGPRDYVFAPLQIPRDYVHLHHSPISMLGYIDTVAEWAERHRTPVVFKPHPYNRSDQDLLERVEHHCRRSAHVHRHDGHVLDLIAGARAVFTVNSGVGFEALFHSTPVVIFGDCDYRAAATFVGPRGLDAAWEEVEARDPAEARSAVDRFLWHYCHRHAFDITRAETDRVVERLEAVIASRVSTRSHG